MQLRNVFPELITRDNRLTIMKFKDSQAIDTASWGEQLVSSIFGIVINITTTSLLTGIACDAAFLAQGVTSPTGLFRVGVMGGFILGYPAGLLISFMLPLVRRKARPVILFVGASIWAAVIGVSLAYALSRMSFT